MAGVSISVVPGTGASSVPSLFSAPSANLCALCGDPLRTQLTRDRAKTSCTARWAWSMAASVYE
jgi:hypothetical protein